MLVDNDFLYLCALDQRYNIVKITNDRIVLQEADDGEYLPQHLLTISSWGHGKSARDLRIKEIVLPPDSKFHTSNGLEITMETQLGV